MIIVNDYLALRWDLWIMHGIEPSISNKRWVERFGLSSKFEDRGETSRHIYLSGNPEKDPFIRL